MTTLRQAILLTADHFEQYPKLYNFMKTKVPDCGTPGCLVGQIGYFLGFAPGTNCWMGNDGCKNIIGVFEDKFFERMQALSHPGKWAKKVLIAVAALRKYADLYHPEEAPQIETYPDISKELARIAAMSKVSVG